MSNDLKLICYLTTNYFSYSIFNITKNCFEKLAQYNIQANASIFLTELKNIINTDSNLTKKYKKILWAIDLDTTTFIPEPLFDQKNLDNYITLSSNQKKHAITQYIKQQFSDCYAVFNLDKDLLATLEDNFNQIKIKSFASILVDYTLSLNQKNSEQILVQVNKNNFHIVLIENRQFKFYNKFNFDTIHDFLYYFMNCIHILESDTQSICINIISELHEKDKLFQKLEEYIKISFLDLPKTFLYSNQIMEHASHNNHILFSQLICE